jgi:hypothetical protein
MIKSTDCRIDFFLRLSKPVLSVAVGGVDREMAVP